MKQFIKDMKKLGIRYAVACSLMYLDEKVPGRLSYKISRMAYDYAYELDYAYLNSEEVMEEEDMTPTPCGCTILNDCRECGSYYICSQFNNI